MFKLLTAVGLGLALSLGASAQTGPMVPQKAVQTVYFVDGTTYDVGKGMEAVVKPQGAYNVKAFSWGNVWGVRPDGHWPMLDYQCLQWYQTGPHFGPYRGWAYTCTYN
jgi:hypothetical protein